MVLTKNKSPILVTGAPRSGTTFLGKMLSLHPSVAYFDEPFNLETGMDGVDRHLAYITKDGSILEKKYAALVNDMLRGKGAFKSSVLRPQAENLLKQTARQLFTSRENLEYKLNTRNPLKSRHLLKDPMACFASEYLHAEMGMRTVVILRHPASTIASYKRLGWKFSLHDLIKQEKLMQDYLGPVYGGLNTSKLRPVEEWAYFWLGIHTVLDAYLARNSKMIMIRHEDLSLNPLHYLRMLYEKLEIPFTERIKHRIIDHTSAANPTDPTGNAAHVLKRNSAENIHRWKKILTPEEISIIKDITQSVSKKYYSEAEW